MLGSVGNFLDGLLGYKQYVDDFAVPKINWREVRPYLEMEHFTVEAISAKNSAAGGLVSWVVNIVTYHDTIVGVEPKRKALAEANTRLETASTKLQAVQEKVADLTEKLSKLRAEFDAAEAEKQSAINEVDAGQRKLDLAQRLTTALASENVRWAENVVQLKADKKLTIGNRYVYIQKSEWRACIHVYGKHCSYLFEFLLLPLPYFKTCFHKSSSRIFSHIFLYSKNTQTSQIFLTLYIW